jgi:hypothetical protein
MFTTKKTCSKECQVIHHRKVLMNYKKKNSKSKKRFDPIPCKQCGKMFTPKSSRNKFCSKKCNNHFFSFYRNRAKPLSKTECPWCHKIFERSGRFQRFCCSKCAAEHARYLYLENKCAKNKLDQLGKILVNRWHRLTLSDGTRSTNKEPWDAFKCAQTMMVPIAEVERAFAEYDAAIKNGTEREFYQCR